MKLRRLSIDRLPGLRTGFELDELSPGVNVVVGPNGSGKSSLCRAVRALVWKEEAFRGAVRSEWEVGGDHLSIERESGVAPNHVPLTGEARELSLPEARFRKCFTLSIDDFLTDRATEDEIAAEIRKELAAGFDLSAILADKRGRTAAHGGAYQKAAVLRHAGIEARRVRDAHEQLALDERGLNELRDDQDASARALNTAQLHRDAVDLAEARGAVREAHARMSTFTPAVQALQGNEASRLEELRQAIAESEEELSRARATAAGAVEELKRAGLATAVPPEDLEALSTREQRLRSLEREWERSREAEASAAARLEQANHSLKRLPVGDPPPELEVEPWSRIESALRERDACAARVAALRAEVELAGEVDGDRTDPPYAEGMRALSRWIEAGVGTSARARHGAWSTIGSGLLLVLAGLAMITFDSTPWWLLITAGVALLFFGIWNMWLGAGDAHHQWEREFVSLGFDPPTTWSSEDVVNRLAQLQRDHERFQHHLLKRGLVEQKRARLAQAEEESARAEARFAECCALCGIPAETAALGLVEAAGVLIERSRAAAEFAHAQALRLEARSVRGRELGRAAELLEAHGEPRPTDATDLQRRRESLAARERTRASAEATLAGARANVERYSSQLERRKRQLSELFDEFDLDRGDEAGLTRLLDQLAGWKLASADLEAAELVVRTLEARLSEFPELADLSVEEARSRLEENDELAALQEPLTGEIARIEAEVNQARQGHELEDALAAEQLARESLEELRQELFEAAAADFLIEAIASEHQSLAQPDILHRAGERFSRFTRHRYRLNSAGTALEEGPGFEIRETDGGDKAIAELSSGTLAQLCLALRLAVAESVERDEALPIFLDEALTNSDPVRFREVVLSLGELAREGRQVFFLTADPEDAGRIEQFLSELELDPPRRYDLEALRGESDAAPSLDAARLEEIPAPEPDEDAAAYGERLHVPSIDPFVGVDAMHAYYLCSDDLLALHTVLAERVETVGQVRELLAVHPHPLWEESARRRFDARRAIAAIWLEAYRIGRAPALAPEILREGPAGKTKYVEALVEIAAEFGGDAERLLASLEAKDRDPRVKGFRQTTLEALRVDLEERGFFSPLDTLSEEKLLERALAAARPHLEDSTLTREEVHQLAHLLGEWLGGPGD